MEKNKEKKVGFVDVRSPGEHQMSTIPGAVNIPVLDDEARAEVGTLYVKGKVEEAKQFGVTSVSKRLPDMYARYRQLLEDHDELVIFCSRGGMRSNSIFSLLKALGMPVSRLQGGYKSYRRYINEHLDAQFEKVRFVTLYGLSGTGKTDILKELAKRGSKTLDLEGCANHRGSVLGSVGLEEPHTQKMFESLLFESSLDWQEGDIVYTEGESKRIGQVVMPVSLVEAIREGVKLYIESSIEKRVEQIHRDYVTNHHTIELIESLDNLIGFFKEERVLEFQEQIRKGQVDKVIETLLTSYYDPRYRHHKQQIEETFRNVDAEKTAEEILKWEKERRGTEDGR